MSNWINLAKTRRFCFWIWVIYTIILFLLMAIQTIAGAWDGAVAEAWIWLIANTIPGLALLLISLLLNRYPGKIVAPGLHTVLWSGTAVYCVLVLMTHFAQGTVHLEGVSGIALLYRSFWWLAPLQLVLILGYYLAFLRKEALFLPNEKIIQESAAKAASDSQTKGRPQQSQCRDCIATAHYTDAFDLMETYFKQHNEGAWRELVLIKGQYADLVKQRDLGLLEPIQAQTLLNKITASALNLTDQVKA
jgi:Effector-associated domain 11